MKIIKLIVTVLILSMNLHLIGCKCKDLGYLVKLRQISYNESDIVFLGELLDYDSIADTYHFRIIELFKGTHNSITISGHYDHNCSLFPKDKCQWIVYATLNNGLIELSSCLASRSINNPECVHCYLPPPPGPQSISNPNKEDYISYRDSMRVVVRTDWLNELELLRLLKGSEYWTNKPTSSGGVIAKVDSIDRICGYKTMVFQNNEFMEQMTDGGGELTFYLKNDTVFKIHEWIGLSYGVRQRIWYLENQKLICCTETEEVYNFVFHIADSIETEMTIEESYQLINKHKIQFYFAEDAVIDVEETGDPFYNQMTILERIDSDLTDSVNYLHFLTAHKNGK